MTHRDRTHMTEFIEKFKELECLWKVTHADYRDKSQRRAAKKQLLKLMKSQDPSANLDSVQKKIVTMRSCFKKEHNKVKASILAGRFNVHIPKLWYYEMLLFLEDDARTTVQHETDEESGGAAGDDQVSTTREYKRSRHMMLEFIKQYKESPCLWQLTHPEYHMKKVRNEALDHLLTLLRTKDSTADRDTVMKHITTLRGCFRKELNKVKASIRAGREVHVPKLWYYNHLTFLAEHEIASITESFDPDASAAQDEDVDDEPFSEDDDDENQEDATDMQYEVALSPQSADIRPEFMQSPSQSQPVTHKRAPDQAEQVLAKISRRLDESTERPPYSAFGEHVAERLRSMAGMSSVFCQKLINDAIFQAEINNLNATSKIVTEWTHSDPLDFKSINRQN